VETGPREYRQAARPEAARLCPRSIAVQQIVVLESRAARQGDHDRVCDFFAKNAAELEAAINELTFVMPVMLTELQGPSSPRRSEGASEYLNADAEVSPPLRFGRRLFLSCLDSRTVELEAGHDDP